MIFNSSLSKTSILFKHGIHIRITDASFEINAGLYKYGGGREGERKRREKHQILLTTILY